MQLNALKKITQPQYLYLLMIGISLVISIQNYNLEHSTFSYGIKSYTHYNNYLIFKTSFSHLIQQKDMYQAYPSEYWDLYKYSPTFALLMAPFAILPDLAGLALWNVLNLLILTFALTRLPFKSEWIRLAAVGFIILEALTSVENCQSNCLMAGLIFIAFQSLERRKMFPAALLIVLTAYIKIFGIAALLLFLFYPRKLRSAAYVLVSLVLLGILPLIAVTPSHLIHLYESWGSLLIHDRSVSTGLSVMGWFKSWFGLEPSKNIVLTAGAVLLLVPLVRFGQWKQYRYRLMFLASILIWVVIFNYRAESPTYVIAVSGIMIWFLAQKPNTFNIILLSLVFVFTILSPTDLIPHSLRDSFIYPYVLKAVPCILVWLKLLYDMMFNDFGRQVYFLSLPNKESNKETNAVSSRIPHTTN